MSLTNQEQQVQDQEEQRQPEQPEQQDQQQDQEQQDQQEEQNQQNQHDQQDKDKDQQSPNQQSQSNHIDQTDQPNQTIQSDKIQPTQPNQPNDSQPNDSQPNPSNKRSAVTSLIPQTSKRRVPGRIIETTWEPLNDNAVRSLDRILDMSLNRCVEGLVQTPDKMAQALSFLFNEWMSNDTESFRERLVATKVPLAKTMAPLALIAGAHNVRDVLDFDQVTRRKRFLETYLLAELRQLEELKRHKSELHAMCELDKQYLAEMRKTVDIDTKKMRNERERKEAEVGLGEKKTIGTCGVNGSISGFDPNKDSECNEVLEKISRHLKSLGESTSGLAELNSQMEVVMGMLDGV